MAEIVAVTAVSIAATFACCVGSLADRMGAVDAERLDVTIPFI